MTALKKKPMRMIPLATGNTLKLSPSGAANHLKNHPFDYAGPCHS